MRQGSSPKRTGEKMFFRVDGLLEVAMFLRSVVLIGLMLVTTSAFAESPPGVWKGKWTSQSTGHQGPMRVRITPQSDGNYNARFTGRFALVIPFTYRATMTPVACDDCGMTLVSSKTLGPVLGSYSMTARVSGNQLQAGFKAAKDTGTFSMTRRR